MVELPASCEARPGANTACRNFPLALSRRTADAPIIRLEDRKPVRTSIFAKVPSLAMLLLVTLLTGCPLTDDYGKAVDEFQHSSTELTSAYRALIDRANLVEEDQFIDLQVFEAQPFDPASIQAHALLTPDEIALRTAAIQALADYTCALASLAEGKPAAQLQADAAKASTSLGKLTTTSANAIVKPTSGSKTPDYAGPVSTAATAIGDVLAFIEKRRGEAEVKDSIRKNDPQLTALFHLLADESTSLYARRKTALGQTGVIAFRNYDVARRRTPPNSAELLQLSDRIKQYQGEATLLGASDPALAIKCFQDSHDKLIALILAPRDQRKQSFAELIASLRAFATEVASLA